MASLKPSILLLGEGDTEFYYFNSIRCLYRGLTIKPDHPKHTNIKELETKIVDGINCGYSHIFCIIDMDTKDCVVEGARYARLKGKYSKPIVRKSRGINCVVRFFETHRCIELFFLYYFCYTSKYYTDQNTLIRDLNKYCRYSKNGDFFRSVGDLNSYFGQHSGNLTCAIKNANKSMAEKRINGRDYTYSELGELFEELDRILRS